MRLSPPDEDLHYVALFTLEQREKSEAEELIEPDRQFEVGRTSALKGALQRLFRRGQVQGRLLALLDLWLREPWECDLVPRSAGRTAAKSKG